jgi:plasmid stabilization system protein ParE
VDFILLVEEAFNFISENPDIFQKQEFNIYRHFLSRFPYSIYFNTEYRENTIKIIAVLHHSRNPEIWKKRAK